MDGGVMLDEMFAGMESITGAEAERAAAGDMAAARAAAGDVSALDGLVERVRGDQRAAFDSLVLRAAVEQQDTEPLAADELGRALRGVEGFRFSAWREAVKIARRTLKKERADAAKAEAEKAAHGRAVMREAEATAKASARAAARQGAADELAEHYGVIDVDAVTYSSEPGRMWMEHMVGAGREERSVTDTLCEFSARIVELVVDIDGPGERPRPALYALSIVSRARGLERAYRVEVTAEDWGAAQWPERVILRPGLGPYGRATREHVRRAIEALSPNPPTRYRFRYVGWATHEGRAIYLHGGGAIDAQGDVEGLRAEPPVERVNRFALPSLVDFDAARDVGAIVHLLSHEPAPAVVPLVGLALRAALGGARHAAHVTGRSGLGKSVLLGCVAQLFGPSFSAREPLLSWRARGVTVQGFMEVLACSRDVFVQVDDLQRNPESQARAIAVFPAHFEGTSQIKGRARGGSLTLRGPQSVLGSSGETLPDEPSVRNRVLLLDLDARPTPRLDVGKDSAKARGDRGELARGMAAFIKWWAARHDDNRKKLPELERATSERWGLGAEARAAEVAGAAAVGLEAFFAFLRDTGAASEADVKAMRERAKVALRAATITHLGHVESESNWRRFLELTAQALTSGRAHALHGRRSGPVFACGEPDEPSPWGWSPRTSTTATDDGPRTSRSWSPGGQCVAYTRDDKPGRVLLSPGPALRVAIDLARTEGRPLHLDVTALARELVAEGVCGATAKGRPVGRVKWSWGSTDVEGFEVPAAALGLTGGGS